MKKYYSFFFFLTDFYTSCACGECTRAGYKISSTRVMVIKQWREQFYRDGTGRSLKMFLEIGAGNGK